MGMKSWSKSRGGAVVPANTLNWIESSRKDVYDDVYDHDNVDIEFLYVLYICNVCNICMSSMYEYM